MASNYIPGSPSLMNPEELVRLMAQAQAQGQGQAQPQAGYNNYAGRPPMWWPPVPTAGDTGYTPGWVPQVVQQPVAQPQPAQSRAPQGPVTAPANLPGMDVPAYTPQMNQMPGFDGLPPAHYLPQLLGTASIQEAMPLPQFQNLLLPELSGSQMFGLNPELINNMVGYVTQAANIANQNAQQGFQNRGAQIGMASDLDNSDLQRAVAGVNARGTHVNTERGIQEFQNYESPEQVRQRSFDYNKAGKAIDFEYDKAGKALDYQYATRLLGAKHAYDTQLSSVKTSSDLALKKSFEIHETNIKNFLSAMDLEDVKRLTMPGGKIDIQTLMTNPSFKLLTNNQKNSVVASLNFFASQGISPDTLVGAQIVNQLQQQGQQSGQPEATGDSPKSKKIVRWDEF